MRVRGMLNGLMLAALSCEATPTSGEEQAPTAPPPGGGQGCRTYATGWSTSVVGRQPTTTSAEFSSATSVYRERSPAITGPEQVRLTYWSPADFIDEASVMARYLYRRADRCSSAGCTGVTSELPAYDAQRRMTSLSFVINGFPLYTEYFTQWDAVGRPIAGTRNLGYCTAPLRLAYDDVARTFEKGPQTGGFGNCVGASAYQKLTFDQQNNIIAENVATGGTGTTWTHTITSTVQACKPD